MSRTDEGREKIPGRVLQRLLDWRLDARQSRQLVDEIGELYEHRLETRGRDEARRWLRREQRRLAVSLALGLRLVGPDGRTVLGPYPHAPWLLAQDVRHSLKGLRRTPLFTAAVILVVGLGIGGTTLVYSVVHAVLIAPLPYPGADRMVLLRTVRPPDQFGTSMADLEAVYDPPPAFDAIAGYTRRVSRVALGDGVTLLPTKWVTDNYFPLLGIEPLRGRGFTPAEGRAGGDEAVMVTERFWKESLGATPLESEPVLRVEGVPFPVVGILPDRLGPLDRDLDVFPILRVETPPRKGPFFFPTVGRLREGGDRGVAREQLAAVSRRIFPIWQDSFTQDDAVLGFVDLKEILVGNVSQTLLTVLTAVALLLLIASANAASLLVARGIGRHRDVAIRTALGASGRRVLSLILTEAAVLAAGGALLGLALTVVGIDLVARLGVGRLPRVEEITLGGPVLLFFVAITVASWALFGVVAAASGLRGGSNALAQVGARTRTSRGLKHVRRGLVAAQFAVTVPLLVGAGLLLKSLDRVQSESFGFDPENLASMLVSLPEESYPTPDDVVGFWRDVLPRIEALPEIASAGLADGRPPLPTDNFNNFVLEDRAPSPDEPILMAPWITADAGFFRTLGLAPREGELFRDSSVDTTLTAVVDEAWVERFYPGQSPIGRRFRSGGCTIDGCPWVEVVGVVQNVKTAGLDDTRRLGTIYFDLKNENQTAIRLYVRATRDPLLAIPSVRSVLAERDPTVPIAEVFTVEELAGEALNGRRYTSLLLGMMASVALLLSIVGVYGAMSYFVRQHTRDIGIRIALGEAPSRALTRVVALGAGVAAAGTVLGLAAALALTGRLAGLLYAVSARDPAVYVPVVAVTLLVAGIASAVPGRYAAKTDPARTLREE